MSSIRLLRRLLSLLHELSETMRQCETDMLLALHLTDAEYPRHLKHTLKQEAIDAMIDILWRLSTELLKLQLFVRHGDRAQEQSAIAKEVKHSPRHAAHDPAALRLQFIQHAQLAAAEDRLKKKLGERKKWGGFFGKIQFKGLRRDSTGKTSRKLR